MINYRIDKRVHYIGGSVQSTARLWPSSGEVSYVLLDTFTDTDTTNILSHTPDTDAAGNGWVGDGGGSCDWAISGNRLFVGTYSGFPVINVGISDYVVSAKIKLQATSSSVMRAIMLRNTTDTWAGSTGYCAGILYNGNKLRIARVQNGAALAETAFTPTPGVDYTLTVTCSGSTITAAIGATSVELTGADTTGSYVGLGGRYTGDSFDDFTVTAL